MNISRRWAILITLVISGLLFGAAHLPTYESHLEQSLIGIGFARVILMLAYITTRNLWVSAGAHIINDWLGFILMFEFGHLPINAGYECPNSRGEKPDFAFRGNTYSPAPLRDVETKSRQRVSVGSMAKFCQGEASATFGRKPQEILTLQVERTGGGFTVYGQFPPEGTRVTTFECRFDS